MSIRSCLVSQIKNKLISNSEQLFIATNLSPIAFVKILPPNLCGKKLTNSQINLRTLNKNKNSNVHTIKIVLDSGASASIVRKDILYKHHRIIKDKKNKWSTLGGLL